MNDENKTVALKVRERIIQAYNKTKDVSWPPSMEYLEKENIIPETLSSFLKTVIRGDHRKASSPKLKRLVSSIGQDICWAVMNAEWKLPKHILMWMMLQNLYRSKQLVTLLNKLGHSEGNLFSLELETAIAEAVEMSSSTLTNKIIRNP